MLSLDVIAYTITQSISGRRSTTNGLQCSQHHLRFDRYQNGACVTSAICSPNALTSDLAVTSPIPEAPQWRSDSAQVFYNLLRSRVLDCVIMCSGVTGYFYRYFSLPSNKKQEAKTSLGNYYLK